MSMEQPTSIYENRPNEDVLEKQREKYIQQEISWLLSQEGLAWLNVADDVEYEDGVGESGDIDLAYGIIAKIKARLWQKNVGNTTKEDYAKFEKEFSDEVIRKQLIAEGIIDENWNVTIREESLEE